MSQSMDSYNMFCAYIKKQPLIRKEFPEQFWELLKGHNPNGGKFLLAWCVADITGVFFKTTPVLSKSDFSQLSQLLYLLLRSHKE